MILKIILFTLLTLAFFLLFTQTQWIGTICRSLIQTKNDMDAVARLRRLEARKDSDVLRKEHKLWFWFERKLMYSGLIWKHKWLSVEWWIFLQIVLGCVAFLLGTLLSGPLAGICATLLATVIPLWYLKFLQRRNRKKTEESLTRLLDFLGSFSITTGELTSVFEQVARYMDEPVRGALIRCYIEASTTGDSSAALMNMADSLEHEKFKELVRNMEISIRYCADFTVLVASSRRSLREYLRTVQERKTLMREGLINFILLMGMSVVVILSVGGLTGMDSKELLFATWPGRLGLGILAVICVYFKSKMNELN